MKSTRLERSRNILPLCKMRIRSGRAASCQTAELCNSARVYLRSSSANGETLMVRCIDTVVGRRSHEWRYVNGVALQDRRKTLKERASRYESLITARLCATTVLRCESRCGCAFQIAKQKANRATENSSGLKWFASKTSVSLERCGSFDGRFGRIGLRMVDLWTKSYGEVII